MTRSGKKTKAKIELEIVLLDCDGINGKIKAGEAYICRKS